MGCTKCWYINERDNPYRTDVYGELSERDKEQMTKDINEQKHDSDCEAEAQQKKDTD